MAVYNEADFVMQGREVQDPEIAKDELELYYDVKGKKNGDVHKDKLLDMSGQGKDGVLSGFDYDGELSGYDGDNGLVFDGIDDTLELGEVEGVEEVSASRNLCHKNTFTGEVIRSTETLNMINKVIEYNIPISPNSTYTLSAIKPTNLGLTIFATTTKVNDRSTGHNQIYNQVVSGGIGIQITDYKVPVGYNYVTITTGGSFGSNYHSIGSSVTWSNIQLEEGSTATPYTPYIPTAKMTYQLNNNVISYGEGGTVKWVKDGEVMERKGINLVRNGNFFDRTNGWVSINGTLKSTSQSAVLTYNNSGNIYCRISRGLPQAVVQGEKIYVRAKIKALTETRGLIVSVRAFTGGDYGVSSIPNPEIGTEYTIEGIHEPGENHVGRMDVRIGMNPIENSSIEISEIQYVNLTATYGAGNEPTLEEIQAEPDKWQWTPNPMDLIESEELKGNILGDMEDIVDASPRDRQSGKEVFTEHADDRHVEVEVDGQSYQHAGSGKNLFNFNSIERTVNPSLLITNIESNGFTVESTNTKSWQSIAWELDSVLEPDKTYTMKLPFKLLSGNITDSYGQFTIDGEFIRSLTKETDSFTATFQTNRLIKGTSKLILSLNINGISDVVLKKVQFSNIQLEEGSTATEYEPPAPTPDYPVEIESVNDFDVVSSVGGRNYWVNKLMWNIENYEKIGPYHYYTVSGLKPNTKYTMSINPDIDLDSISKAPTGENRALRINNKKENPVPVVNAINILPDRVDTFERTITSTEDGVLYILNYNVLQNEIGELFPKGIILKEATDIQEWTPAPEDITESDNHPLIDKINLNLSEPLRSVRDVKDRIYKDSDGLWKVERKINNVALNGSETMYIYNSNGYGAFNKIAFSIPNVNNLYPKANNIRNQLGSHHPSGIILATMNANGLTNITFGSSGIYFVLNKSDGIENIADAKAFLEKEYMDGNPVSVQYDIETPIIETLNQELQDKLNNLRSFRGSNYVYTVQNTDNPHKEQLKPTLHATFNSKDYLKETRTLTNLLIWARELSDEELIHHNTLFLNRFNLPSDRVVGEPIEQTLNLLHGGMVGHSLEQNYTINI